MQLCPQYVPVKMLWFLVSIRGRGHQLDSTKNDFHPTSALSATTWYSIPYGHVPHWSLAVLWSIGSSGCFIGILARHLALLRRLLTVRLLMRQLTIHLLRSMFAVLNGCCLARLLRSQSSLAVVFRVFPVLWSSFTLLVWFTRCFNRTMTEWLTLNRSAVFL
jgi:hypothetical protein